MPLLARNYENSVDHWGYSTVCETCKADIEKQPTTRYEKGINFAVIVEGYPIDECNCCHRKVAPKYDD